MAIFSAFFQIINSIVTLYCGVYGFSNFKYLKKSRILVLLPICSGIQIIFVEVFKTINHTEYRVGLVEHLTVMIYLIFEIIVILIFFYSTSKSLLFKSILIIILLISVAIIINDYIEYKWHNENDFKFQIFEGIAIEFLSFFSIARFFMKGKIENVYLESENLFTIGIFFGFVIIAPFSVLQNFLTSKGGILYEISFIANSFGYLIMFIFFILGIYASRKSNTI